MAELDAALLSRRPHAPRAQHLLQLAHHVHRQADHAALVHHRALDRLAYPPGGIGGEAKTALGLELVDRVDEKVAEPIDGGLIREDGKILFPIRQDIPVMLIDQGIPLGQ